MQDFPGLKHFKNSISSIFQWTDTKHKKMEKVFLGILTGAVNLRVLTVAHTVLDFIYYAQYQSTPPTPSAL